MKRKYSRDDSPAPTVLVTEDLISTDNEIPCISPPSKIRRQGSKLLSFCKSFTGRGHGKSSWATDTLRKKHTAKHNGTKGLSDWSLLTFIQHHHPHTKISGTTGNRSVKSLHQSHPDRTFFCARWRLSFFEHRPSPPQYGDLSIKQDLQYSPRRHFRESFLHHQPEGLHHHFLVVV